MCQKQALPQRKYQYDACNGEEFDKHHNLALKSPKMLNKLTWSM